MAEEAKSQFIQRKLNILTRCCHDNQVCSSDLPQELPTRQVEKIKIEAALYRAAKNIEVFTPLLLWINIITKNLL